MGSMLVRGRGLRMFTGLLLLASCAWGGLLAPLAAQDQAQESPSLHPSVWYPELEEALRGGSVLLNLRLRGEIADSDGARGSQAYTSRLRLGYRTGDYRGFSVLAEMEDLRSLAYDMYNAAGLNGEGRRTVIADPETTELNQLYLDYDWHEMAAQARVGRQRIQLDDDRFVGNVGWRQNEQTYDALLVTKTALEHFHGTYAYVWDVHRIFGDQRSPAVPTLARDFESDSHFLHASYTGLDCGKVSVFGYLLDFTGANASARANSTNTFGARFVGDTPASDEVTIGYALSYAHQVDGDDNPSNYKANYWLAEVSLGLEELGRGFVGFEHLGSESGRAQFVTPLATAHKFNGWADSFLDNGGPSGLQDVYVGVAPKLPWELMGQLVCHKFSKADAGGDLGWEFDAVVSKKLSQSLESRIKYAYFDGREDPDLFRLWFELIFAF